MNKDEIDMFAVNDFLGYDLEQNNTNRDLFALMNKVEDCGYKTELKSHQPLPGQSKQYSFSIENYNGTTLYKEKAYSREVAIIKCIAKFVKDFNISEKMYAKANS